MKSKIYLSVLLVLTILFSSCGSLTITQKRYSRGLNIDLFTSGDEKKSDKKANVARKKNSKRILLAEKEETTKPLIDNIENLSLTEKETIASKNADHPVFSENATMKQKGVSPFKKMRSIKNSFTQLQDKQPESNFKNTIVRNSTQKSDSDVALLILVIIALFIPPLAVFLYYGEINGQFWISLILTLLAAGAFGIGIVFGWGIPIIHALLVIFGVIG